MTHLVTIVASACAWPLLQLAVFWLRFNSLPPGGPAESLVFAPMGLAAGLVAAVLLHRSASRRQRRLVLAGYLAATPFAFLGSLLGGLVLVGATGPLVFGAGPLSAGCVVGFLVGRDHPAAAA